MSAIKKSYIVSFFILTTVLSWFLYSLIFHFGFAIGAHLFLLTWSFFVLCTPAPNGGIILDVPFSLITHKSNLYSEIIMWGAAILFNLASFKLTPTIYFKTNITHLLYLILAQPWPLWSIIAICGIGTFYSALLADTKNRTHLNISRALTILSLCITIYLSFHEFILVLNSHGTI
jgi:hypothetical protein